MPSATLQALSAAPTVLPPPVASSDPRSAGMWFDALPPQAQAKLKMRLEAIVSSLPPVAKLDLQRYLVSVASSSPVPLGALGAGEGMDWGALIVGVIGAGAGLYSAAQAGRTQNQIAANQASSNTAIQNALLAAQTETNAAIIAAQRDAAIAAEISRTQRASVYAPTIKWGLLGVGGIALVGGLFYFLRHRRA